jgi:hypothetical protein
MYFTDDSLLPENQEKLIIKAAPWGPQWLPTLFQLGLPPNRKEGRPGFLGYATDGKLHTPTPASDSHPLAV